MGKRKFIDWDSIEPLYRAGQLSLNGICAQYAEDHKNSQTWKKTITHGAIVKKAKAKGWSRNLAGKVKERVKEKLVTSLVTGCDKGKSGGSDEEIIERAAEAGSNVVLRHRVEINALLEHENALLQELIDRPKKLYMANYQGKIISKEIELTIKERSATLKDLASVRAQRIALERQAHNLDDNPEGEGPSKIVIKRKTRDSEE